MGISDSDSNFSRETISLADSFKDSQRAGTSFLRKICKEQYNFIYCLDHYNWKFPPDCVRYIFSFLPTCYYCHMSVIENAEERVPTHQTCITYRDSHYECVVCQKPASKQDNMVHTSCMEKNSSLYFERYRNLEILDLDIKIGPFLRTLKLQGLLLRHKKCSGKIVNVKITRPFGYDQVNMFVEFRSNDEKISSEKKKRRFKRIGEYSFRYNELHSEVKVTIRHPFDVKLSIYQSFIYLYVGEKIFLFREDQLCPVFRFLDERIVLEDCDPPVTIVDDSEQLSIERIPSKFRNTKFSKLSDLKKYRVIREIIFSKQGFIKHFFQVHGLFGRQQNRDVKRRTFSDLPFFNRYLPLREVGGEFSRITCCELPKKEEGNFYREQKWIYFRPGMNAQSLLRPRTSCFSRIRPRTTFKDCGNVITHLNIVMMDTIYRSNMFSMIYHDQAHNIEETSDQIRVKLIIYFDGLYYEWDENEILVGKKSIYHCTPIFRTHFKTIVMDEPKHYLSSHLRAQQIIEKYNMFYRYSSESYRNYILGERNSYDFVEEFFNHLYNKSKTEILPNVKEEEEKKSSRLKKKRKTKKKNIQKKNNNKLNIKLPPLSYPFWNNLFFKTLRYEGTSPMRISLPPAFMKKFHLKYSQVEFKTHKQLDDFVRSVDEIALHFEYVAIFDILKSFDAIFWGRHEKWPKNEKYLPSKVTLYGCPFQDPKTTHAYNINYF